MLLVDWKSMRRHLKVPWFVVCINLVGWPLANPLENFCTNFLKTVSAGARSRHPLLIELKTSAGGFENHTKTSFFCRGVDASACRLRSWGTNAATEKKAHVALRGCKESVTLKSWSSMDWSICSTNLSYLRALTIAKKLYLNSKNQIQV